jgi:hypothetical protein
MDQVIYEDTPQYDSWLKAIMVLPVFFIVLGVYYLFTADICSAVGLFATALLMGCIYWAIFPRKYQILDSKLRIVLGGQFTFNVPFDNLEHAGKQEGVSLGLNFATTFITERIVEIKRKKGMNVNITPSNRDLFLENLNQAIYDWKLGSKK